MVYICNNLLHLAVESCDLSQVEEKVTVVRECVSSGAAGAQTCKFTFYAPADFEASSTMCTRFFETQSTSGCTCTRRSKILTHSLDLLQAEEMQKIKLPFTQNCPRQNKKVIRVNFLCLYQHQIVSQLKINHVT